MGRQKGMKLNKETGKFEMPQMSENGTITVSTFNNPSAEDIKQMPILNTRRMAKMVRVHLAQACPKADGRGLDVTNTIEAKRYNCTMTEGRIGIDVTWSNGTKGTILYNNTPYIEWE